MVDCYISQVVREMNKVWSENNPALFIEKVWSFQEEYPIEEWRHCVDLSRKGFIKLIAWKRSEPWDLERDYLKEIGY